MLTAVICERMGWDYNTYMDQPHFFIELIIKKMEIDAMRQKAARTQ